MSGRPNLSDPFLRFDGGRISLVAFKQLRPLQRCDRGLPTFIERRVGEVVRDAGPKAVGAIGLKLPSSTSRAARRSRERSIRAESQTLHGPPGRRCSTRERDLGPIKPIVELPAPSDERKDEAMDKKTKTLASAASTSAAKKPRLSMARLSGGRDIIDLDQAERR
jgi:hypothetical protein